MADFEVKIRQISAINPIEGADRIVAAKVDGYNVVVGIDQFQVGSWCVYIPEASLLPEWLVVRMGLEGRLAGKNKNRVKAIKLKGVLSQGLCYPIEIMSKSEEISINVAGGIDISTDNGGLFYTKIQGETGGYRLVVSDEDVQDILGITKYEPPIPIELAGQVQALPNTRTLNGEPVGSLQLHYDIENIKKYSDLFDGLDLPICITEKIHGTFMAIMALPNDDETYVSSKGLLNQGLCLKNNEDNKGNVYIRYSKSEEGQSIADFAHIVADKNEMPVWILGELFGVQDMKYGLAQGSVDFRIFDMKFGDKWLSFCDVDYLCKYYKFKTVPVLYVGEYNKETIELLTSGDEHVSGDTKHLREGVVIRPFSDILFHDKLHGGRIILKSVSEAYLLRKDKNATEFA